MARYPNTQCGLQHQRGFSLIEAMFSALILAIALLALAGFHVGAFQDSTLVKSRMAATNLAQEKLDDLRSFNRLKDDPAVDEDLDGILTNDCGAGKFCFSEIAINTGGREEVNSTTLILPTGAVAGAFQDSFTRTWDVTCATTETSNSALSFGTTCAASDVAKLVKVKISWVDSKGAPQEVLLQSVIYNMDPANGANAAVGPVSGKGPKISYTPIGVPDAVPVPINTGGSNFKESSKPVPDISTSSTGAEVSFDAVSYATNGSGYDITEREEFVTASCECSFGTAAAASTPSRMIWNGASLEAKIGTQIVKPVGTAANGQSAFCTACCKDHHDVTGTAQPKYDPDRPAAEYTAGGDHKHYWYSSCVSGGVGAANCTNGQRTSSLASAPPLAEVTSGAYLDSCRFKRVDGYWRMWQDWRQIKMTVIPSAFLPVTANLTAYVNVIKAAVENTIRTDSGNGSTAIPALTGRDITFTVAGGTNQLLGRVLYVDRVYQKNAPTTLDTVYYNKLIALIGASSDWLNIVPFYEANLTLLIDWSSSVPTTATVTSQPIIDISNVNLGYYDSFSRGRVTAVAAGTAVITAKARLHNSGVTGGINTSSPSYGISGYDDTGPLTDSITVTVASASPNVGVNGKFIRANASVNFGTLSVTGATCSLLTSIGNELPYNCTVSSGATVTLGYSSSVTGYSFSPASQAFVNVIAATSAGDVIVYGQTVKVSGTATGPGGAKLTAVSATNGMTCTVAATGRSYSCTVARGTGGYTGTLTFTGNNSLPANNPSPSTLPFTGQQADAVVNVSVSN